MTYNTVNIGAVANDGTGDALRTAFDKINSGIIALEGQTNFNTRLALSNLFIGDTFTVTNANITGNLILSNVSTISAETPFTFGNVEAGNIIVAPGGLIYGTIFPPVSISTGEYNATRFGIITPAEARVTNLRVDGNANISDATQSTSITSGALKVTGGVGIQANVNIGGNLVITSNTHIGNVVAGVNTGIWYGNLKVVGGALQIDGDDVATSQQNFTGGDVSNQSRFLSTFPATNPASGAVIVTGGVGVGGNLHVGGNTGMTTVFATSVTAQDIFANTSVGLYSNGNVRGTLISENQPYIRSIGTLSNLTVGGNITANLSNQYTIGEPGVPFLELHAYSANTTFLSGSLTTSSQPAVTYIGTQSNLTVTGNVIAQSNVIVNANVIVSGNTHTGNIITRNVNGSLGINSPGNIILDSNVVITKSGTYYGKHTFVGNSTAVALNIQSLTQKVNVSASAPTTTTTLNYIDGSIHYFTSPTVNNWTINLRGSADASLNAIMDVGDTVNFAFIANNGATAYYSSSLLIDGTSTAVTLAWLPETPVAGTASNLEVYSYNIIKTASATYTVLASKSAYTV